MSSTPLGPVRRAWLRWKSFRLPWRKRFLVGLDLNGNTFWEFHNALGNSNTSRMRRIIQFQGHGAGRGAGSTPFSDVTAQISPAWHQWLRHTRLDPPSLTEQSQDLIRQQKLKILAKQADERWEAKRRIGDAPNARQALPTFTMDNDMARWSHDQRDNSVEESQKADTGVALRASLSPDMMERDKGTEPESKFQAPDEKRHPFINMPMSKVGEERRRTEPKVYKDDPWKKARSGPGEEWQPEAWNPISATSRR